MQRTAILPDRDEESILLYSHPRERSGDLTGVGEVTLRLLPPTQILIVLIGAPAELLLVLSGGFFTVGVSRGMPLSEFGTLAVFEVFHPAGELCLFQLGVHRY